MAKNTAGRLITRFTFEADTTTSGRGHVMCVLANRAAGARGCI